MHNYKVNINIYNHGWCDFYTFLYYLVWLKLVVCFFFIMAVCIIFTKTIVTLFKEIRKYFVPQ